MCLLAPPLVDGQRKRSGNKRNITTTDGCYAAR